MTKNERGPCRHCGQTRRLRKDGTLIVHKHQGRNRCDGSGYPPAEQEPDWRTRALHLESALARLEGLPVISVAGQGAVYVAALNAVLADFKKEPDPDLKHGDPQTYRDGCHCPLCRAAWASYQAQYKRARRAAS